jgi:SpoIID/LytB domain protein
MTTFTHRADARVTCDDVRLTRIGIVLPCDRRESLLLRVPARGATVNGQPVSGGCVSIRSTNGGLSLTRHESPSETVFANRIVVQTVSDDSSDAVRVPDCMAGRGFHWERPIDVDLSGTLEISPHDDGLLLVNELPTETYLMGVITAEMGNDTPTEFMKAQCIVARSWMMAATERKHDSLGFDYCDDDCCQRFQGVATISSTARSSVLSTEGLILRHSSGCVVDANYSKSCGGITEHGRHVWGHPKAGQRARLDAPNDVSPPLWSHQPSDIEMRDFVRNERWTHAYCGPESVRRQDLPRYLGRVDDGRDFFRWTQHHTMDELQDLLTRKFFARRSVDDRDKPKRIADLRVTRRGFSGRAIELAIDYTDRGGRSRSATIEDQYWIRHALHDSFLYSSAFVIDIQRNARGIATDVTLTGAGWGHGAGMCQIGALGMSLAGFSANDILDHYFDDVSVTRLSSTHDAHQ